MSGTPATKQAAKQQDVRARRQGATAEFPVRLTAEATGGLVLVVVDPGGHVLLHPQEARRMAKLLRAASKAARKSRKEGRREVDEEPEC